jgi:hypothetical protein
LLLSTSFWKSSEYEGKREERIGERGEGRGRGKGMRDRKRFVWVIIAWGLSVRNADSTSFYMNSQEIGKGRGRKRSRFSGGEGRERERKSNIRESGLKAL